MKRPAACVSDRLPAAGASSKEARVLSPDVKLALESKQARAPGDSLRHAITCMVGRNPRPSRSEVEPLLKTVATVLLSVDKDDGVLVEACRFVAYVSDGDNSDIGMVLDAGISLPLVKLLSHSSSRVQELVLKSLCSLTSGDDHQTGVVLNNGLLMALRPHLNGVEWSMRKETCSLLSNLLCGSRDQVQAVFDSGLFPQLLQKLDDDRDEVCKAAAFGISHLCHQTHHDIVKPLLAHGFLEKMVEFLCGKAPGHLKGAPFQFIHRVRGASAFSPEIAGMAKTALPKANLEKMLKDPKLKAKNKEALEKCLKQVHPED